MRFTDALCVRARMYMKRSYKVHFSGYCGPVEVQMSLEPPLAAHAGRWTRVRVPPDRAAGGAPLEPPPAVLAGRWARDGVPSDRDWCDVCMYVFPHDFLLYRCIQSDDVCTYRK